VHNLLTVCRILVWSFEGHFGVEGRCADPCSCESGSCSSAHCFVPVDVALHVREPLLLVHQEGAQVVLVVADAVNFPIEHQVHRDFILIDRLRNVCPREHLVWLRGGIVRIQTQHRAQIIRAVLLLHKEISPFLFKSGNFHLIIHMVVSLLPLKVL
jgi:hypothetical protein